MQHDCAFLRAEGPAGGQAAATTLWGQQQQLGDADLHLTPSCATLKQLDSSSLKGSRKTLKVPLLKENEIKVAALRPLLLLLENLIAQGHETQTLIDR